MIMTKANDIIGQVNKVIQAAEELAAMVPTKEPATVIRTSVLLPPAMHEMLRKISFAERIAINELIREGIEHVIEKRAYSVLPVPLGKQNR
jgi:hypothetical protein